VTVRPITGPEELNLFCRFPYVLNAELADDLDAGRRRPEWRWVALRGDRPVARLAWWGREGDSGPQLMDVFDVDDAAGWHEEAAERRAVENRMAALTRTGAELFVERLRLD
jgi:hypothetical protein